MMSATFAAVAGFALIHLLSPRLRVLKRAPRSIWLSIAGGVSVAYVFVHVLPELSAGQRHVSRSLGALAGFLEHHVYLIALLGLAIFYGLDKLARASRQRSRRAGAEDRTSTGVFWVHICSFAVYNALVGYLLLHREQAGLYGLFIFTVAMALHFIVTDHALYEHHKALYRRTGRYILMAALIIGWLVGLATKISEATVAMLFAFLAGGVMLNVLKEELPEECESRYWAFALGLTSYTVVLLAL
jgi:hypothetical protein